MRHTFLGHLFRTNSKLSYSTFLGGRVHTKKCSSNSHKPNLECNPEAGAIHRMVEQMQHQKEKKNRDDGRCRLWQLISRLSSFSMQRKRSSLSKRRKQNKENTHLFHLIQIISLNTNNLLAKSLFDFLHLQPCLLVVDKVDRYAFTSKTSSSPWIVRQYRTKSHHRRTHQCGEYRSRCLV